MSKIFTVFTMAAQIYVIHLFIYSLYYASNTSIVKGYLT